MPICNSNLALPERSDKILASLRSQEVPAVLPSMWSVVEKVNAMYEKVDIPAIVRENCSYLDASDKETLLSMLLNFEPLFNGTIDDWNLPPLLFELKEDMKPCHGRPYPILHKHKSILIKENKRLCNIGVLEWKSSSRYTSPTFTTSQTPLWISSNLIVSFHTF